MPLLAEMALWRFRPEMSRWLPWGWHRPAKVGNAATLSTAGHRTVRNVSMLLHPIRSVNHMQTC